MKIIANNSELNIDQEIGNIETILKQGPYILQNNNHIEHLAAYIAWKNVGGKLFVLNPFIPEDHKTIVKEKFMNLSMDNIICFTTSGTTGVPKLIIETSKQLEQIIKSATNVFDWNKNIKFLNFFPAFTTGYWHVVLVPTIHYNSTLLLGSRDTIMRDINMDFKQTIMVPSLIDFVKFNNIKLDLSCTEWVGSGASAVYRNHAQYAFESGANKFINIYGTTEVTTPMLTHTSTHIDDDVEFLDFVPRNNNQIKLINNELYIKGPSLAENYLEFDTVDGWLRTHDLFEQKDNLIRYTGRNNDVVKINGLQCSLFTVEKIAEIEIMLGECIAVPRQLKGIDYIELFHTKQSNLNKKELQNSFRNHLPKHMTPSKFTLVESIKRNGLGKKIRHAYTTNI